MSRYRPPRPAGSKYITPEGAKRLREELDYLWRTKRPEVTAAVSAAAALGDRSENAEYIYGKKQLREIDSRVRFLRKRLEGITIVQGTPDDPDRIFFGAWFELEDQAGETHQYRLVGPDEIDLKQGWISIDSPMGRAVRGKTLDDTVTVPLPKGEAEYLVITVQYQPF